MITCMCVLRQINLLSIYLSINIYSGIFHNGSARPEKKGSCFYRNSLTSINPVLLLLLAKSDDYIYHKVAKCFQTYGRVFLPFS